MACPICTTPEGASIAEGMRAGAAVMIVVTTTIVSVIARFGYRLWAAEGTEQSPGPPFDSRSRGDAAQLLAQGRQNAQKALNG